MDTRTKIIIGTEAERVSAATPTLWVKGSFDPLLAEHANTLRQLTRAGQMLIVCVTDPARPLMPRRARAELLAGILVVDYVVLDAVATEARDIDEPHIRSTFIEHVITRHGEAAG